MPGVASRKDCCSFRSLDSTLLSTLAGATPDSLLNSTSNWRAVTAVLALAHPQYLAKQAKSVLDSEACGLLPIAAPSAYRAGVRLATLEDSVCVSFSLQQPAGRRQHA